MCGINGVTGKNEQLVRAMNEATKHRGPDATGVWTDGKVTLGSNRLAIIDLSSSANQPMQSADGRYTIVFNGEIYNFRELRSSLVSSHDFKTEGDTEVIVALFARYGVHAFTRLNGMFGLAIWDSKKEELTLARDQSGIKPLYYRHDHTQLSFSSEVKGVLTDEHVDRTIDREALGLYLRLRYVPEPLTLVAGIKKLLPGSYAVFKNGELSIHRYFEPKLQPLVRMSAGAIEAKTRALIDASVARQLVSDRPVGVFLSGGLDSSIVLDAATKAGGVMETFSLNFALTEEEQADKFNADARIAQHTATHYAARHHEITLSEEEFVESLPDVVRYLDQPIANATSVAQYVLAKKAREHIVVALQGDGGDELFGGYPRYRLSRVMDLYQTLPSFVRAELSRMHPKLEKLNTPAGIERIALFHFEKDTSLMRAIAPEYVSAQAHKWFADAYLSGRGEADFTQLFMDIDRRSWLVDEALARTDTMTMGASLEARVPLLDPELVEFASALPTALRVGLTGNKQILRRAFRDRLPGHLFAEKKRGFFSPTAKWLRRPKMQQLAREVLSKGYDRATDDVLGDGVLQLLESHVSGGYAMNTLWTIISLRLWAKSFRISL